jgi:hypothetical protein
VKHTAWQAQGAQDTRRCHVVSRTYIAIGTLTARFACRRADGHRWLTAVLRTQRAARAPYGIRIGAHATSLGQIETGRRGTTAFLNIRKTYHGTWKSEMEATCSAGHSKSLEQR